MSIEKIRFRVDGEHVILQVLERIESDYAYGRHTAAWRDAKDTDLLEVARYTRAYDSLDSTINSLQNTVIDLQQRVSNVLDQTSHVLERAQ